MNDDVELVREFATNRSEPAFAALVERHLGLVYSAALRQTGDPCLAEEISQNVFLILSRKAGSFGHKTVLSAWLYRTTRYVTADALKARRRRQAREQEAYMQSQLLSAEKNDAWEQLTPLLDEAMAHLGEADRTAVVLRFFQNRSAREIAGVLRVEEATAQKRVSRALEKLRAILMRRGVTLSASAIAGALTGNAVQAAPAGLVAVITSTAAQAAGGGVGLGVGAGWQWLSALAKSWFVPLFALAAAIPSLIFVSVVGRMERENFRDSTGFRFRLHRQYMRSFLWGFPILLVALLLFSHSAAAAWGLSAQQGLLLVLVLALTLLSARSLAIARNPFQLSMFCYTVIIALGIAATFLGWIPRGLASLPILLATLIFFFAVKQRPMRMDYSLFLRAAKGMLRTQEGKAAGGSPSCPLGRSDLLSFARFLGSHYLVTNYRWEANGLTLRLPPVRARFLFAIGSVFAPFVSARCSRLILDNDRAVRAHCSSEDAAALAQLEMNAASNDLGSFARESEGRVQAAVAQAWSEFSAGRSSHAERALGEVPASDIFLVPPGRARPTRWWRIWIGATVLLLAALMVLQIWRPSWMDGWENVSATEPEVRAFLNEPATGSDPRHFRPNSPALALFSCLVLPSTNLFTPEAMRAMRDEIAGGGGFGEWRTRPWRAQTILTSPLPRHAVADGWISLSDLDLEPSEAEAAVRGDSTFAEPFDRFLTRCQASSWVNEERFEARRVQLDGVVQLRLLRALNCLDLVDREGLIRQIASVQVLSATPPNQPRLHDWRDVKGLFFTPCFPALQDTYYALAALEILGGLDRIDRDACIRGILSRHRGKGYFTSPLSGGYNEYHIDGGARDTIAAFESLRILGALDRVKDLEDWEFRVKPRHAYQPTPGGGRTLTWDAVEAWVAQQRFEAIIPAHREHPKAPFRSLLDPVPDIQDSAPATPVSSSPDG